MDPAIVRDVVYFAVWGKVREKGCFGHSLLLFVLKVSKILHYIKPFSSNTTPDFTFSFRVAILGAEPVGLLTARAVASFLDAGC
jgi:hypothetical protein